MASVFTWFGVFAAAWFTGMAVLIAFAVAGWGPDRDDWRAGAAIALAVVATFVVLILGGRSV